MKEKKEKRERKGGRWKHEGTKKLVRKVSCRRVNLLEANASNYRRYNRNIVNDGGVLAILDSYNHRSYYSNQRNGGHKIFELNSSKTKKNSCNCYNMEYDLRSDIDI
jgi:hypothetical protein